MAFPWGDSFGHYNADVSLLTRWWTSTTTTGMTIVDGRFTGTKALRLANGGGFAEKGLGGNYSTIYFGFSFYIETFGNGAQTIVNLIDGSTTHCGIGLNTNGTVFAFRASTANVLGTGTTNLQSGIWYSVQGSFTIADNPPGGTWEIKVNGTTETSGTGDTRNGALAQVNSIRLNRAGGTATIGVVHFQDIWISDSGFQGDLRCDEYYANAAGDESDWSQNGSPGGASNFNYIDDNPANGTDTVQSSTAGDQDLYGFADVPGTPDIKFTQHLVLADKDDAGARSLKHLVKSGGTIYASSAQALSTTKGYLGHTRATDPATGSPWTATGLNNAQLGQELV